ncbi:hypothetical protein JOB18_044582 [Solea senegalensis]|uniref:Uncharacterized protein n=1 Tax=Solea senegalensis TaxID=28829 RepID=A0AAV6PTM4_SOLSE|nr:hypothetical protein JOB18_044582 [Solea senegalensis]
MQTLKVVKFEGCESASLRTLKVNKFKGAWILKDINWLIGIHLSSVDLMLFIHHSSCILPELQNDLVKNNYNNSKKHHSVHLSHLRGLLKTCHTQTSSSDLDQSHSKDECVQ